MEGTSSSADPVTDLQPQNESPMDENYEQLYEIDFTKELNIPRGVDNVDELEMLTKKYTEDPELFKDAYVRNLFEMIAYHSFEDVTTKGQLHRIDQYILAAQNFELALETLKKREWVQERILQHLNPPNVWPEDFIEFLDGKNGIRNRLPTKALLKHNNKISTFTEKDQKAAAFGNKIATSYSAAKLVINTVFNRLWKDVDDLESGQTISGLFRAIRQALWLPDARRRATSSWNTNFSRKKKMMSTEEYAAAVAYKEQEIKSKTDTILKDYNIDWYPPHWFIFVAYGKPVHPMTFDSLNDGTVDSIKPMKGLNRPSDVSPASKLYQHGKAVRQAHGKRKSKEIEEKVVEEIKEGKRDVMKLEVELTSDKEATESGLIHEQVANLEKQISLLEKTNMDPKRIQQKQLELLDILEQQQKEILRKRDRQRNINIDGTPITSMSLNVTDLTGDEPDIKVEETIEHSLVGGSASSSAPVELDSAPIYHDEEEDEEDAVAVIKPIKNAGKSLGGKKKKRVKYT